MWEQRGGINSLREKTGKSHREVTWRKRLYTWHCKEGKIGTLRLRRVSQPEWYYPSGGIWKWKWCALGWHSNWWALQAFSLSGKGVRGTKYPSVSRKSCMRGTAQPQMPFESLLEVRVGEVTWWDKGLQGRKYLQNALHLSFFFPSLLICSFYFQGSTT